MNKSSQNRIHLHTTAISIIIVLSIITYLNCIPSQFIYDDTSTIVENRLIKDWKNFSTLFNHDYFKYSGELTYRPIVTLSYFIDYSLWHLNPIGYHIVNMALHTINVVLIYILILLLLHQYGKQAVLKRTSPHVDQIPPVRIAVLTCLLFTVHPVVSEVVNVISYREDLFAMILLIASFIFFLLGKKKGIIEPNNPFFHNPFQDTRETTPALPEHEAHKQLPTKSLFKSTVSLYIGALITYFLALHSKESAAVLPVLIFLFELLCNTQMQGKPATPVDGSAQKINQYSGGLVSKFVHVYLKKVFFILRAIPRVMPFTFFCGYIGITVVYLTIRFFIFHNPQEKIVYPEGSFYINLLTMTKVLGRYLTHIFLPLHLNADYHVLYLKTSWTPSFLIPLFLLISLIFIAIRLGKKAISGHFCSSRYGIFTRGDERAFVPPSNKDRISNNVTSGKYTIMIFAILWFFVSILPVMNIIPLANIMADRYLYLPVLGFCLFISTALAHMRIAIQYPVIILFILFFLILTVARNDIWRNEFTLWHKSSQSPWCSFTTYNNLGTQYNKKGYPDMALQCYQKALQKANEVGFSRYATVYYNIGNAYEKKGLLQQAVSAYKNAILIKPDYTQARNNLGKAYFTLGQYEDAFIEFNNTITIDPDFAYAYNNLGVLYSKLGKKDDALAAYKKALSLDPQYSDAYYNLGNIYEAKMQYDLALEAYQTAIKFNPTQVYVHNNLGTIYDKKGLVEDAIREYKHAIKLDPTYPYSYNNLGASLIKMGDMDGALIEFQKAVSLLPDQPDFHFNLGYMYLQKGNPDSALRELEVVREIAPNHAEALFSIGTIYYKQGDKEKARNIWQSVLRINPNHVKARKCLEMFMDK